MNLNLSVSSLLISATLAGCATTSKPSPDVVVLETTPRPVLEISRRELPSSGSYSQQATTYWEKVDSWRARSRSLLKGTPAK